MKRYQIMFALLAALFVSCQTDADVELTNGDCTTLAVSLCETTKTSLGEKEGTKYPVYWSEGDRITVNGIQSYPVSIDAENLSRATFTIDGILEHPYSITYPHTSTTTAKNPKVVFMKEQSYVNGSFSNGSAPMCGYVENRKEKIVLQHLAGVLQFAVSCEDGFTTTLKSVTINSSKALAGEFEVNCQDGTITPTSNSSKSIVYTLPNKFTLSSDEVRYINIVVPHGTLGLCEIIFSVDNGRNIVAKWNGTAVKAGVVREFKSLTFNPSKEHVQLDEMYEDDNNKWDFGFASPVKGYITSNGKPLEGVVVSDGLLCTKTDEDGYYWLDSNLEDVKFVMVSIPSGYTAPTDSNGLPIFYHRVTDKERYKNLCVANFSFNKINNNADRYTLLVGADPQPRARTAGFDNNAYHSLDCCNDLYRDMREKAATITDRNVYGLMLGDIVHENMDLYDNYIAGLKTLGFPMFNVLGNHDNDKTAKTDVEGRRVFEEKLGPTYYSFNIGKMHFVVLDNLIMKLNDNGDLTGYDQGLTDEIWQWLQNDLSYVDRSATLMVAAHSPMFKLISGGTRSAKYRTEYGYLFADFAATHVWTGHTHTSYNYVFPSTADWVRIEEHTVARSTGELWTNEYIAGGTPRGYTVVEVDGDNISWYFKPTIYQTGSFVSTKYTSKKPSYTYRDWNYSNGVAKMKADGTTLSESYQMKVYKPRQYHDTYDDMIAGNAANNYVYVNIFLWDSKWQNPKYNGVEMEKLDRTTAYCLATYEINNHYSLYGYKLQGYDGYGPENNNINTIFRAKENRTEGSGTVTVTDRFGNNYSSSISW